MAAHPTTLRRVATGPLQGTALTLYFVLLPYVIETKWRVSYHVTNGEILRDLLVGLAIFWIAFLALLVVYIGQRRRHGATPANGCAWLAGVILTLLPFLMSSPSGAATTAPPTAVHAATVSSPSPERPPRSLMTSATVVPMVLATKRRAERLRGEGFSGTDDEMDALIASLRNYDERVLAQLRALIPDDLEGVIALATALPDETAAPGEPVAVLVYDGDTGVALRLSYARAGGRLAISPHWELERVADEVVGLHEGHVVTATSEHQVLRALATRPDGQTLVVYVGAQPLDPELAERCVTVRYLGQPALTSEAAQVRVELLRANPQVYGLCEPFVATLRRRCVEMVAYLAMHPDPTTGERLRNRVLVHADVDASKGTLSNTATAIRRSLGADQRGPRLHPVSSAGLYELHGVDVDVTVFHQLIAQGRAASAHESARWYFDALALVQGEPLASVAKGFEWFFVEGHLASLQRDGEWAALALHDAAKRHGDFDTAFWALRQGLLLDPNNDVLLEALYQVPRLREFGGDAAGTAQDEPVGTSGAVAMSWSFQRFGR